MPPARNLVRHVRSANRADFDDRLWPVNVALVILGGCVAGIIAAVSSFEDPRLLYNGWARLGGLAVVVLLLMLGAYWLGGKVGRRLQLCIVISLLVHLALAVGLHQTHVSLATLPGQRPDLPAAERPEQNPPPADYHWQPVEPLPRFQQAFEEPIETPVVERIAAETMNKRAEIPRVLPAVEKSPLELQPLMELQPPDSSPPQPAAPPRRSDQQPELAFAEPPDSSRQTEPADVPGQTTEPFEPAAAAAITTPLLPDEMAAAVARRQTIGTPAGRPSERAIDIPESTTSPPLAPETPLPPRIAQRVDDRPQPPHATPIAAMGPTNIPRSIDAASGPLSTADMAVEAGIPPAVGESQGPIEAGPGTVAVQHVATGGPIGSSTALVALANDLPVTLPTAAGPGKARVSASRAAAPAGPARSGDVASATASVAPMPIPMQRLTFAAADEGTELKIPLPLPTTAEIAAGAAKPSIADLANIAAERPPADAPQHRQPVGLPGQLTGHTAGPVEAAGPASGPPAAAVASRRSSNLIEPLALLSSTGSGSRLQKTNTPGPIGVPAEMIAQPAVVAAASAESDAEKGVRTVFHAGQHVQPLSTQKTVLTPFSPHVSGIEGLGSAASPQVEVPSRRAPVDQQLAYNVPRGLPIDQLERTQGGSGIDGSVSEPTKSYRHRDPGRRSQAAEAHGGGGTERAVEAGLDFFARIQFPDGHWSLHKLPEGVKAADPALGQMESDSAATGLALLTYLGAGYTHLDNEHRAVMGRAIGWLLDHQKPSGELFTGGNRYARFYSHGIAAIALCEAYGMTQDPDLREPARKAVEFIVNTQHPTRGGWRYDLRPDTGRSSETDTSVSGWQLMALRSAQMAGLEVPTESFQKLDAWLDRAAAQNTPGRYIYNPYADRSRAEQLDGLKPSLAMTSEAMLMRMYLGRRRDDPQLIEGAAYLQANLPQMGTPQRPLRDCYYWYYATQAMFQMQGDYWDAWNGRMRPLLLSTQVQDGALAGSWHPWQPVRDRWGVAAGRVYVTAIHLLMLEVYYRYLPLFQDLSK